MMIRVRLERLSVIRLTANLFIVAGGCALLAAAWALGEGAWYQFVQDAQFPGPPAQAPDQSAAVQNPPAAPPFVSLRALPKLWPRDPLVIARLEAPAIQLSVIVREGVDDDTLRKAVGHLPSTAGPGGPGNFVVLGHRDTFFRPLRKLERGDAIYLRTQRQRFRYVVESIQVMEPQVGEPRWEEAVRPAAEPTATLITCFPFRYTGPAPKRFVVQARLSSP